MHWLLFLLGAMIGMLIGYCLCGLLSHRREEKLKSALRLLFLAYVTGRPIDAEARQAFLTVMEG